MEINEAVPLCLAGIAGGLLGLLFFGGLWWTIQRGVTARHPAILFFVSLLTRMSVTMAGFWMVSGGEWKRLAMCLAGFILARLIVMRFVRSLAVELKSGPEEVRHAP